MWLCAKEEVKSASFSHPDQQHEQPRDVVNMGGEYSR